MIVQLNFTNKGQAAINLFDNSEIIEIFTRYIKTLTKNYDINTTVPVEDNNNIKEAGTVKVIVDHANCDVEVFFKELGRDIKVPLKKRIGGTNSKLDNVFKVEVKEEVKE
ncbi:hypothetical protein [Paenibacillus lemnae]|uniref:Uncharacterized protein n=1 Tax=Paenibacillus lemnae TaxID=1330551 RepID=A0A848M7T0_PAELE|nr:hypothetical protein [Paenibacillus lemnae]NMO97067.1 hypothetical protein [Paenibacillus lemnae]